MMDIQALILVFFLVAVVVFISGWLITRIAGWIIPGVRAVFKKDIIRALKIAAGFVTGAAGLIVVLMGFGDPNSLLREAFRDSLYVDLASPDPQDTDQMLSMESFGLECLDDSGHLTNIKCDNVFLVIYNSSAVQPDGGERFFTNGARIPLYLHNQSALYDIKIKNIYLVRFFPPYNLEPIEIKTNPDEPFIVDSVTQLPVPEYPTVAITVESLTGRARWFEKGVRDIRNYENEGHPTEEARSFTAYTFDPGAQYVALRLTQETYWKQFSSEFFLEAGKNAQISSKIILANRIQHEAEKLGFVVEYEEVDTGKVPSIFKGMWVFLRRSAYSLGAKICNPDAPSCFFITPRDKSIDILAAEELFQSDASVSGLTMLSERDSTELVSSVSVIDRISSSEPLAPEPYRTDKVTTRGKRQPNPAWRPSQVFPIPTPDRAQLNLSPTINLFDRQSTASCQIAGAGTLTPSGPFEKAIEEALQTDRRRLMYTITTSSGTYTIVLDSPFIVVVDKDENVTIYPFGSLDEFRDVIEQLSVPEWQTLSPAGPRIELEGEFFIDPLGYINPGTKEFEPLGESIAPLFGAAEFSSCISPLGNHLEVQMADLPLAFLVWD